ncbi:hypothetical protein BH24ACT3_BH24ACT3_06650 [soil metagenome]
MSSRPDREAGTPSPRQRAALRAALPFAPRVPAEAEVEVGVEANADASGPSSAGSAPSAEGVTEPRPSAEPAVEALVERLDRLQASLEHRFDALHQVMVTATDQQRRDLLTLAAAVGERNNRANGSQGASSDRHLPLPPH